MTEARDPRLTPWQIDESEFYELESASAQLAFLVRYAVLAPSAHNTQPWSFRVVGDGIEVYADFARRIPVADANDRELMLSVGAAIANLRVAAAHFGYSTRVAYPDDTDEALPIALIATTETCAADPAFRRLFSAIQARHTNRGSFDTRELDDSAAAHVCDFIDSQAPFVQFVVRHDLKRAADLVERADVTLMSDERFREELAACMRPNDTPSGDGICTDGFGIPDSLSQASQWMLRTFDIGSLQARRDRELLEKAAGLVVITAADERVALLRAGETLELLLLTLTRLGVAYSFLNSPVEVPELREELWSMIRSAQPPQLMIRIGYSTSLVKPQPRRDVDEVLAMA